MSIRKIRVLILFLASLLSSVACAYDISGYTPDQIVEYKQTTNSTGGAVGLDLHVFTPDGHQPGDNRPAIVFFFGGGWVSGSASQFHPQCEYLASRGMVAISAEYRVRNQHGTTPQECVKDGKSAIRYVRENAAALGIDPNRIAAGGGSAGGHVAAATGTLTSYEEPGENLAISSRPDALVLYNPVVDNGPGGYGHSTVQAYWQSISPLHNITVTAPPTVFLLGTNDALVPVSVGTNYQAAMEALGRRCDLHLYQNQEHSFFNFDVPDDSSGPFYGYRDSLFKTDAFLVSLGWLDDPHAAPEPVAGWVTIFGDAGFGSGSQSTASPVTTDADADAIAANFNPATLADGDFIRLTGSVTLNAPLTGNNFRVGLFDGDNPVTAGDGTGYVGIWTAAPATVATTLSSGNGSGASNPFEVAASTTLGPIPAASATVPANTAIGFTLMIARNGNTLDLTARFSDGTTYRPEQNLINQALAYFQYDSVAFLMTGNLNATQAVFSNVGITRGRVLPAPVPPPATGDPVANWKPLFAVSPLTVGGVPAAGLTTNAPVFGTTNPVNQLDGIGVAGRFGTAASPGSVTLEVGETLTVSAEVTLTGGVDITNHYRFAVLNDGGKFAANDPLGWSGGWIHSVGSSLFRQPTGGSDNFMSTAVAGTGVSPVVSRSGTLRGDSATAYTWTMSITRNSETTVGLVTTFIGGNGSFSETLTKLNETTSVFTYTAVGILTTGQTDLDQLSLSNVVFSISTPDTNTFDSWIAGFDVGGETGFNDDPDRDGIPSGVENFFGTNPGTSSQGLQTVAANPGGTTFTFTHPQNPAPAEDLVAVYQWSSSLDAFFAEGVSDGAGNTVDFTAQPDTPTTGITTVVATVTGPGNPSRLFVRIQALQAAP